MRNFENAKRIVVKIGTNILTKDSSVDTAYVRRIAHQIVTLLKSDRQVVIISSGAIGMGRGQLSGYQGSRESGISQRQSELRQGLRPDESVPASGYTPLENLLPTVQISDVSFLTG